MTGSPEKIPAWKEKYHLSDKNIYDYSSFDRIVEDDEIDIVYIVLPNFLHAEYVIKAARAGKHVICEKPMAINSLQSIDMINACKENNVRLFIGYRLHFDPYHQELMRFAREEWFGPVKFVNASIGYVVDDASHWRLNKNLSGGGSLTDLGVYCVQLARYSFGEEPIAVTARTFSTNDPAYASVGETTSFRMEFTDGRFADAISSYASQMSTAVLHARSGNFSMESAFGFNGIQAKMGGKNLSYTEINQAAAQMDAIALAIEQDKDIGISGMEGLRDQRILDACLRSAGENGKRIIL